MGQRLNIEVWDNGKVLANAYYHWSAFTSSAAELTKMVLDFIRNNEPLAWKFLTSGFDMRVLWELGGHHE